QRYEFTCRLEERRKSLMRELDYRQEAHKLAALREQLKGFTHISVPAPIADYTTSRVLAMEYVPGVKITEMSPLTRMDFDGEMLAEELFRDRKSTRLNSSHRTISYGVFCLKENNYK